MKKTIMGILLVSIFLLGCSNTYLIQKVDTNDTLYLEKLFVYNATRIQPTSAAPASPALGDIYIDSTTNELCFFNSTAWIGLQGRVCA